MRLNVRRPILTHQERHSRQIDAMNSREDLAALRRHHRPCTGELLIARDPFVSIDTEGVGELIRMASARGRATRNSIKLGICGEHGGDPDSIRFCHDSGLDYVSCSPFRVPVARLAAAQAALAAAI